MKFKVGDLVRINTSEDSTISECNGDTGRVIDINIKWAFPYQVRLTKFYDHLAGGPTDSILFAEHELERLVIKDLQETRKELSNQSS